MKKQTIKSAVVSSVMTTMLVCAAPILQAQVLGGNAAGALGGGLGGSLGNGMSRVRWHGPGHR
jgi:hypothetical protein